MKAPITLIATLPAWITSTKSVDRILRYIEEGQHQVAMASMYFCDGNMDKGTDPWVRVGEADITVRLHSKDELVSSQLAALQQELSAARAEWLTKQQQILEQISNLQALTNEVPTEVVEVQP